MHVQCCTVMFVKLFNRFIFFAVVIVNCKKYVFVICNMMHHVIDNSRNILQKCFALYCRYMYILTLFYTHGLGIVVLQVLVPQPHDFFLLFKIHNAT